MDKYTKFILTVIAVALIGNLFDKDIVTEAQAGQRSNGNIWQIVDFGCKAVGDDIQCSLDNYNSHPKPW